jgi:hypothetical protein
VAPPDAAAGAGVGGVMLRLADVLNRLVAEGLAPPQSVARARAAFGGTADTTPPWYARVIAGFGAWVATGFLIAFLIIADIVDNEMAAMIVGTILVAAAVFVRRGAKPDEEFRRQVALAVSLAGQVLVIVGMRAETESTAIAGLVATLMSVLLVILVPDQAHRFMSAIIGSIGLVATMAGLRLAWRLGSLGPLGGLVVRGSDFAAIGLVALTACVWRAGVRTRRAGMAEMLEPVGYGTIAALLMVLAYSSWLVAFEDLTRGSRAGTSAWVLGPLTTIAIAVALTTLVVHILRELRVKSLTAAMPLVLALLALSTPGIIAAVALLVLGFDRRNRVLIGLAIAFLIKFLSVYYYSLHMTLLEKSIVLVASGLLLLAGRVYLELRHKPVEAEA